MASEVTRDPHTLVYTIQCLRCGCTGTIDKNINVETACSCLCCHYKDSSCVYTSIDRCIDCNGKYYLQGGKTAWTSPYFSCERNCLRTKKSPLSVNFDAVTQNHRNNVRNTIASSTHKTLLHSAVLACDPELTWDLLCRGSNPFVKDRMGVTPIDLARLMLSGISTSHSPRLGVSNEEKIFTLLPKQAYPDVSIEFPQEASEEVSKIRTHSDFGPDTSVTMGQSPQSRSPYRRRNKHANRRPSPTESQWQLDPQGEEAGSSKSVLSSSGDNRDRPPPAVGLRVTVPEPNTGLNDSILHRRHRSQTLTLSSTGAIGMYPPSPPRVTIVDNFSIPTSPSQSRRRHRAASLSATEAHQSGTAHTDNAGHTGTPMPVAGSGSYGFARRQRGMSLTESPTSTAAGGSKSLLTGIVNAGIRHAKANAPQLSQGKQVFSPMTLLRISSGNEFVMEDKHNMPVLKEEDIEYEFDGDEQEKVSSEKEAGDVAKPKPSVGAKKHDYQWEIQHLKNVIVAEVEVEDITPYVEDIVADNASVKNDAPTLGFSTNVGAAGVTIEKGSKEGVDMTGEEELNPYAMFAMTLDAKATSSPVPKPRMNSGQSSPAPLRVQREETGPEEQEQEDSYDSGAVMTSCTGCMDLLPLRDMKYTCPRVGTCLSHLCQDCLFRLVFVTITSALYAVPAIRCPGRCMCAIPTRMWRGGLKGMLVAEEDREGLKVADMPIMMLLDLLYNSFEVMCMDYETAGVSATTRFKHTCTLLSRVEDIAASDGFTLLEVYGAVNDYTSSASSSSSLDGLSGDESSEWEDDTDDEAGNVKKASRQSDEEETEQDVSNKKEAPPEPEPMKFSNFAEFSAFVLPGRVVKDSDIGHTFMALEEILNHSEVESARLNVKKLRKKHMHNFLAEVAALVRTRMDVTALEAKFMDDGEREDAEELLVRRYMNNAQALLKIRCSGCDETANLLHCVENGKKVITSYAERRSVLDKLVSKIDSEASRVNFLRTYNNFMTGKAPSSLFVTAVFESFIDTKKCDFEEDEEERNDEIRKSAKSGVLKLEAAKHINKVLSLIVDVERRFAAQLEVLRKYPKIKLVCCDTKHCFLCKVGGHHKGQSCAEVQRAEMGTACQFCPGCGVATMRTEGCKEVLCVCGTVWKWEADDENSSTEGDWEDDSDSDSDCDY